MQVFQNLKLQTQTVPLPSIPDKGYSTCAHFKGIEENKMNLYMQNIWNMRTQQVMMIITPNWKIQAAHD